MTSQFTVSTQHYDDMIEFMSRCRQTCVLGPLITLMSKKIIRMLNYVRHQYYKYNEEFYKDRFRNGMAYR